MATTTLGATAGPAVSKLTGGARDADRFDYVEAEVRPAQIEAIDERFQERRGRIKLLDHRARQAGIDEIRSLGDVVPLLFPHTAYKSYPESFLLEGRWDRLTRWLGTISPHAPEDIDPSGVADIDGWIDRMAEQGIFVSFSSGTTGSPAMLPASQADVDWTAIDCVESFSWGAGVAQTRDRRVFMLAPVPSMTRINTVIDSQWAAFGDPAHPTWRLPMPPITVSSLTNLVLLRKKMTDGTAMPEEIAEFERTSEERAANLDEAMATAARAIVDARDQKLFTMGYWGAQYQVAKLVREMGYGGDDFDPDPCMFVAGGLKRATLPDDYEEFVYQTFNFPAERRFGAYSMQEINSTMPRCREGNRYHVPPWLVPLVLDQDGEVLAPRDGEVVEGRAAFFDLALDGRWGGVISGDRISLDYGTCACGVKGPSIRDDIVRYADLAGDDKIGCAGTVDAYVRGLS